MSWIAWLGVALAPIAAFVVAEFVARAWLARNGRYYVWSPGARMRLELDRTALPNLDPVARHVINRDGERAEDPPSDAAGTYRILVVGGSAAECYYLDQETQWPFVLQQELAHPENLQRLGARHVHVGNVARSLVTCQHVDRILEKTLDRYAKLDAIVFMVGASDVVTWMEHGTPATVEDVPIPASQVFASHPEGPFGWSPKTLAIRRVVSAAKRRGLKPVDVRQRAGKRLAEVRAMRASATDLLRVAPDPKPMVDHFEKWFERCIRRAQAKAPLVLVVRQPWLQKEFTPAEQKELWSYAVGRPYHQRCTTYFAHEAAWTLLKAVDDRAALVCERVGVPHLDLMPVLPRDFTIWYDEQHHTPAGCHMVGEAVARALVRELAREAKPVSTRA